MVKIRSVVGHLVLLVIAATILTACNPLDRKTKSGLYIKTNDVPASLFLDGQYLDKTPYVDKNIRPGTYTLRIQPDDPNLVPYETTVTLNKGLLTVVIWKPGTRPELSGGVIYEMEKLPNKSETQLSLVTIPDNGIVKVDGQPKDFAPVVVNGLATGQHEFEVTLPSYEAQKHTLNMEAGYKINVTVKLAKAALEPTISAPAASPSAKATTSATPAPASTSASPQPIVLPVTGPRVKIKPTGYVQNGVEVLRVRATPSAGGTEVGLAKVGQEYPFLKTEAGWHQITINGQSGWVSGNYAEVLQ